MVIAITRPSARKPASTGHGIVTQSNILGCIGAARERVAPCALDAPVRMDIVVVFPAPLWPSSPVIWPL